MTIALEQEAKFRVSTWEDGLARLERAGAVLDKERYFESNQLFDFEDERLGKRDQALRLRSVGHQFWLTWKGPHHGSGRIKQRRELESFLGDGEAVAGILEALGFVQKFGYEKYRQIHRLPDVVVTLDDTPIGVFIEIEGKPEAIHEAAGRLQLDMDQALSATYPRLYQLHRMEHEEAPPFMVFPGGPSDR